MRISHNVTAMKTSNVLSNINNNQAKTLQKLGSGQKINKAGDDSAGLAISEKMRGELAVLKQQKANQQDLVSFGNAQDGALNEISNLLVSTQQLLTQSGDTFNESGDVMLNDVALGNIATSIVANIDAARSFMQSEINGISLFSNESFSKVLGSTFDSLTIYNPLTGGQESLKNSAFLNTFFQIDSGTLLNLTANRDQLSMVEAFADNLNQLRGAIGSKVNQAEATVRNISTQIENLQESESRIRDADMSEETVEYQKNNILNQAATSMLAQANQQPQSVLSLLQQS